ncbi:ATP-binding cassette domain-containing protein [Nocardia cyriacigeorgica]|uniref:Fe(3+) ions import ATP-binding protein FbpC n=1 Tax=Nocardia cyriacigeorgica TaxID=135487 RepID=A0A4U8W0L6_9NOCA|nr:ABC transporter ATP-binding protein [Nocardia cyriacigeorgica]VFA99391.1 Fe(3+) ions import ATP-binding protein FbpC [Nocardia cyriacigeorgica]
MSAARPQAFAVRGLTKRYDLTEAIGEVSFTVPPGTVAALVGPEDAGKTTVVGVLLGLLEPTAGAVEAGGFDVSNRPDYAPVVGGVLDPRGLHPGRTIRDHLRIYAAAAGLPDRRVREVLEQTGLTDFAGTKPDGLSPGRQLRAAIATALLPNPQLLVLDDPTLELDSVEHAWLTDFLRGYSGRGGSALVTGRSLAAVLPFTDSIVVLSEGSVVYQGSPARLRRNNPDRLVVATSSAIALATALAVAGYTDAVIRQDGRLAVAEANQDQILAIAGAAGVRIDSIVTDPIHPDRVLASLTTASRHRPVVTGTAAPPQPARPPQPSPMPYGIPR